MLQDAGKWHLWKGAADLEVDKEAVQFLLTGAAVKVLTTRLQQDTHEPDTEQVLGRIQCRRTCIYSERTKTTVNRASVSDEALDVTRHQSSLSNIKSSTPRAITAAL